MNDPRIDTLEKNQMKDTLPPIRVGDTVKVAKEIVEGKKTRIQTFEGVIIKRKGAFNRDTITVRRMIGGIGVEKQFLLHSPLIKEITCLTPGAPRRADLRYLRDRVGAKSRRIKVRKVAS